LFATVNALLVDALDRRDEKASAVGQHESIVPELQALLGAIPGFPGGGLFGIHGFQRAVIPAGLDAPRLGTFHMKRGVGFKGYLYDSSDWL
jgi:hypothetical protein